VNTKPVFTKVALPINTLALLKTENVKEESFI
jgi:hypothetical protein